jgi:hypothetical protein
MVRGAHPIKIDKCVGCVLTHRTAVYFTHLTAFSMYKAEIKIRKGAFQRTVLNFAIMDEIIIAHQTIFQSYSSENGAQCAPYKNRLKCRVRFNAPYLGIKIDKCVGCVLTHRTAVCVSLVFLVFGYHRPKVTRGLTNQVLKHLFAHIVIRVFR